VFLGLQINVYTSVTETPLYFYAASLTQTRGIKQAPLEKVQGTGNFLSGSEKPVLSRKRQPISPCLKGDQSNLF